MTETDELAEIGELAEARMGNLIEELGSLPIPAESWAQGYADGWVEGHRLRKNKVRQRVLFGAQPTEDRKVPDLKSYGEGFREGLLHGVGR